MLLVLTNKINHDSNHPIKKARLVAKGYNQRNTIDYFETVSPVARLNTIRTLMAMGVE